MRGVWLVSAVGMLALLAGCGGRGPEGPTDPDDLPVSCVAKPDPGHCRGRYLKFYFDYRDNRCKPFSFSGCGGRVPFETLEDCVHYCGATP